jgi:hypothetical protein
MKTRSPKAAQQTGLPPPPAPTARDANPWPMSGPTGTAPQSSRQPAPRGIQRGARGGTGGRSPAPSRSGQRRWVPVAILLFIAGTGVQLAMQALESGDLEAALGALVILAMAALIAWRRLSRKS